MTFNSGKKDFFEYSSSRKHYVNIVMDLYHTLKGREKASR